MVVFTGQKNVALWSAFQLLINYCQEKMIKIYYGVQGMIDKLIEIGKCYGME
jgi:site-specific DNA-adenine methylase